jgi:hypothetical protein
MRCRAEPASASVGTPSRSSPISSCPPRVAVGPSVPTTDRRPRRGHLRLRSSASRHPANRFELNPPMPRSLSRGWWSAGPMRSRSPGPGPGRNRRRRRKTAQPRRRDDPRPSRPRQPPGSRLRRTAPARTCRSGPPVRWPTRRYRQRCGGRLSNLRRLTRRLRLSNRPLLARRPRPSSRRPLTGRLRPGNLVRVARRPRCGRRLQPGPGRRRRLGRRRPPLLVRRRPAPLRLAPFPTMVPPVPVRVPPAPGRGRNRHLLRRGSVVSRSWSD